MNVIRPDFVWGLGSVSNAADITQIGLVEKALDYRTWIHTGFDYQLNNAVLARTLKNRSDRYLQLIAKVKARDGETLVGQVDKLLSSLGIENIALLQIADNPAGSLLLPGGALRTAIEALKKAGKVGGALVEFFWEYSENLHEVAMDRFFDGAIFYFNVVHREVSNEVFDKLISSGRPIAALKALGGGPDTLQGTAGRAAVNRFVPFLRRRGIARRLADLRRQAGISDEAEFRYRFLLSVPQVRWIVGGASTEQHLNQAIRFVRESDPLPVDIRDRILSLQAKTWSTAGLRIGAGTRRTFSEKVAEKLRALRRLT